jgi:hypothetical protein
MWKFLPGVSKPKSKRKVDTRESNKAYDATKRNTMASNVQMATFQIYRLGRLSQILYTTSPVTVTVTGHQLTFSVKM